MAILGHPIQPIVPHKPNFNTPHLPLEDARRASFIHEGTRYSLSSCSSGVFKEALGYQGTREEVLKILEQKELDLYDRWYVLQYAQFDLILPEQKHAKVEKTEGHATGIKERQRQQRAEILRLSSEGKSSSEIAVILGISKISVSACKARMKKK